MYKKELIMDNAAWFNKLLSLQCPLCDHENDIYTFYFELHCTAVKVVAKKTGEFDDDLGYAQYEVLEFTEVNE
jgi:hypothetical protein